MKAHIFREGDAVNPQGALMPLGGYKGYGLALFCELLGGDETVSNS